MSDTTDQYARKSPFGAERYREMVAAMRRQPKPDTPPPVPAAEDIANVVEDLRKGRAQQIDREPRTEKMFKLAGELAALPGPVVDATAIYNSLAEADKEILVYEDHPNIAPPWGHAVVAYQNGHGNIVAMDCTAYETNGAQKWVVDAEDRPDDPPVEWDRVRWVIETFIWVGGQSGQGKRLGTSGPAHMWRFAVYPDGQPADLSWVHLRPDYPMEYWDMAYVTLLGALNFMNCFAGDTEIVTNEGILPIGELAGRSTQVLSRDPAAHSAAAFVDAEVKSFGKQPIIEVDAERNGTTRTYRTTAGHRWFVRRRFQGNERGSRIVAATTVDLSPGDRLVTVRPRSRVETCLLSGIGAAHGVVYGDGSRNDHGTYVDLIGTKKDDLIDFFPAPQITQVKFGTRVSNLPRSFKDLPGEDEGSSYLYSFLAGWFATDGDVGKTGNVRLSCAHAEPLEWVHRVALARLGIVTDRPVVVRRRGINGVESPLWSIRFDRGTLAASFFLRPHHRERYESREVKPEPNHWKVVAIRPTDAVEEVFCAVVPNTETFVLDGMILTGNCRNVEMVEPQRPRAQTRRIARTGVTVKTLNVFPAGRSSRSAQKAGETNGVPLTSVRGHFASYGEQYGRGLLFGKLEGRFWIPAYARGSAEQGENQNNYKLKP